MLWQLCVYTFYHTYTLLICSRSCLECIHCMVPYICRKKNFPDSVQSICAWTVEGAIPAMGQMITSQGQPDPCLNHFGKIDFWIQCQIACSTKWHMPLYHINPIPLPALQQATTIAFTVQHPCTQAIADMLALSLFFLLQPSGKYWSCNEWKNALAP